MKTSLFDYDLPKERIAQAPMRPRDHARLLVLDRTSGSIEHHRFYEINSFLKPGDLLVVNETKVFNARLHGQLPATSYQLPNARLHGQLPATSYQLPNVEVFLLRPTSENNWIVLVKPGKKIAIGSTILFQNDVSCTVREKRTDGTVIVSFNKTPDDLMAWTETAGSVPVPPYVESPPDASDDYQTVYAKSVGSVAAPTAGFHFTPELIEKLRKRGIRFASVTLHVGLGTFRPVKAETIEEHEMHEEWINVPEETKKAIAQTKQHGGRVIAVGTTTVRALESDMNQGFTNIFITPGYQFKTIDALITNFHLPKSTLLMLVSAFAGEYQDNADAGRQMILRAYEEAIREGYRFFSFGDAMLIA